MSENKLISPHVIITENGEIITVGEIYVPSFMTVLVTSGGLTSGCGATSGGAKTVPRVK